MLAKLGWRRLVDAVDGVEAEVCDRRDAGGWGHAGRRGLGRCRVAAVAGGRGGSTRADSWRVCLVRRCRCASRSISVVMRWFRRIPLRRRRRGGLRKLEGATALRDVSCPSVSACVAVDAYGSVFWSLIRAAPAPGSRATVDPGGGLISVSCPSVSLCVAVGGRDVVISTDPTGGAGAWTLLPGVDQSVGPECGKYAPNEDCAASLVSLSCPSVSFCLASDDQGGQITSTDPG